MIKRVKTFYDVATKPPTKWIRYEMISYLPV